MTLTYNEALAELKAVKLARATLMPTEQAALNLMFETCTRLKEFGWRDASYAPKDGSKFEVIEFNSTGIFDCMWDKGYWVLAHGDRWPSDPVLFRSKR